MFRTEKLSFGESHSLNSLVRDYLERSEKTTSLYEHFPDEAGFLQMLSGEPYLNFDRKLLVDVLGAQARSVSNSSEQTLKNIAHLSSGKTYTVTTGHQLCLFTGPLYFIYKIFSAINLCETLSRLKPECTFVPVYWMATEDHDFAEMNHFNTSAGTIRWHTDQKGAVGRFSTEGLNEIFSAFSEQTENSKAGEILKNLFASSYTGNKTLAQATRHLVNGLFGQYGLVVIDGDDAGFKASFRKWLHDDVISARWAAPVESIAEKIRSNGYAAQVNPRKINSFYLDGDLRGRIERNGDSFEVVDTNKRFSLAEMEMVIANTPEKISPNVITRPLYQQVILPNIAYIGGPGELAYWLELRQMFSEAEVQFPVLVPRSFITIIERSVHTKMAKLGLKPADLFISLQDQTKKVQEHTGEVADLSDRKREIEKVFGEIRILAERADKTLTGNVSAEMQRAINGLDGIESRINRSLRQRSETELRQLQTIRGKLFPGDTPQERYDNFSVYYQKYGPALMDFLKTYINPLDLNHHLVFAD